MVFDSLFKKNAPKPPAAQKNALPSEPPRKADNADLDFPDLDESFEKEMESPGRLMAEDILKDSKLPPPPFQPRAKDLNPEKPALSREAQKIPAFISLDKYKEIRRSIREMKGSSIEMRQTLASLRQNRDGGTELLNKTVDGLEKIENDIDKIKGILRA